MFPVMVLEEDSLVRRRVWITLGTAEEVPRLFSSLDYPALITRSAALESRPTSTTQALEIHVLDVVVSPMISVGWVGRMVLFSLQGSCVLVVRSGEKVLEVDGEDRLGRGLGGFCGLP